jgi:Ca-activated chloride channel family protein
MTPQNQIGLVTFASGINDVVPIAPLADNRFSVADIVQNAEAGGGTALYDAVRKAVQMVDEASVNEQAIRGVVVLSDGMRTSGDVPLSDLIDLRTQDERPVGYFEGRDDESKANLMGAGLATTPQHQVHIFSVAYGDDADLEVLRIFAEATNATFNKAQADNLSTVMETFGRYF